ncbi:hypothetical protein BDF21DRAFT_458593 [Thamnidium elegans]|nr:hypothetical protein BDF21DRAFT_458593 [Thamnidium elegans]
MFSDRTASISNQRYRNIAPVCSFVTATASTIRSLAPNGLTSTMQKSSILLLISALCLAGAGSVSASSDECEGLRTPQLLPDEKECDLYIDCLDGSGDTKKCPQGQTFDAQSSTCKDPQDSLCFAKRLANAG